ncbi:MAG: glutamate 5-kinase [Pseudomonadota bacterium]
MKRVMKNMDTRENNAGIRQDIFSKVRRMVVKVGSGVVTKDLGINIKLINHLANQVCWLGGDKGVEVILVTSGAIASGLKQMDLARRPADIPAKQALAAIGQGRLMMEYERAFAKHGRKVAQVLLTMDDLGNRRRYLNARNTLYTLLDWKVVPVINENDTVVVKEIQFGDNDTLSAMITHLMDADMLVILTDTEGLFDKNPRIHPDANLISMVPVIDRVIEKGVDRGAGPLGTGGMYSKIQAAKKVTTSGIPMVIASGFCRDVLKKIFKGDNTGTLFLPKGERMTSRKRWIAFTLKPKGVIIVDSGAEKAIINGGKSLLPAGVFDVQGTFGIGSPVQCKNIENKPIAVGLVNYSASEIRKVMGLKTTQIEERLGYKHSDEIIHRDNLVVVL